MESPSDHPAEDSLESAILKIALARNLVSEADVFSAGKDDATTSPGSRWGRRIESLRRRGLLDEATIENLERAARGGDAKDAERTKLTASGPSPQTPEEPSLRPPSSLPRAPGDSGFIPVGDRFELRELLGEGGMGRVFRAFDPTLGREVALKFLRSDDPEMVARFLGEARAQARIQHPNVCRIFEAGETGGRPFIAMELIAGKDLRTASNEMSLEQKILIIRKVADAVHEAHRIGLVHRDLKPANIMVVRGDDGSFTPFVMDFGLAREMAAPGLTQTGMLVGTPGYMAPEQARADGRHLDRRVDIYALGATLFALLTGRPPFDGQSSVDVLVRLLQEDAPSPRTLAPSVPVDVEAIVLKCLEKDPAKRYDSARALADDLGRFLDGDVVRARRAGFVERLLKKFRRHKAAVIAGVVALLAIGIGSGSALRTRWRAEKQAELARQLGQETTEIAWILRVAHTMPLHDLGPEREEVEQRMTKIRGQITSLGTLAVGPGNQALGLGHLALGQLDLAKKHLTAAWDSGYRSDSLAEGLGRALGGLYQRELFRVLAIRDAKLREKRRKEIELEFRDPALDLLRRTGGTAQGAERRYIEALIAFYEKKLDRALSLADQVAAQRPRIYEAHQIAAAVHIERAVAANGSGDYPLANRENDLARERLEKARSIGESDPVVTTSIARLWRNVLNSRTQETGGDVLGAFQKGVEAAESALKADPARIDANVVLASLHRGHGQYQMNRGEDPTPALEKALAALSVATTLDPKSDEAWTERGLVHWVRADWETGKSGDAIPWLDQAIGDMEKGLALEPNTASAWSNMGILLDQRGSADDQRGKDPRPWFERSTAAYRRAIELGLDNAATYSNLAVAFLYKSDYELAHSLDPTPSLEAGRAASDNAISRNPNMPTAHQNLGVIFENLGEYKMRKGDPGATEMFDRAAASYRRALEVKPDFAFAWSNLARVLLLKGRWLRSTGGDPTPLIEEAIPHARHSIELYPGRVVPWLTLGELEELRAQTSFAKDLDLDPGATEAVKNYRKALEISASSPELRSGVVRIELLRAARALRHNKPATEFLDSALRALPAAPPNDEGPREALTRIELAILRVREARRAGKDASRFDQEASDRLAPLLSGENESPDAHLLAAELARRRLEFGAPPKGAMQEETEKGLKQAARAAELRPILKAESLAASGFVRLQAAKRAAGPDRTKLLDDALADFAKALATNRNLEMDVSPSRLEAEKLRGNRNP